MKWVLTENEVFPTFFKPILRDAVEKKPDLTRHEAQALIHDCMKILYERDARSLPKVSCNSLLIAAVILLHKNVH